MCVCIYIYIYKAISVSVAREARPPAAAATTASHSLQTFGSSRMWCLRMWCLITIGVTFGLSTIVVTLTYSLLSFTHVPTIIKHHILELPRHVRVHEQQYL